MANANENGWVFHHVRGVLAAVFFFAAIAFDFPQNPKPAGSEFIDAVLCLAAAIGKTAQSERMPLSFNKVPYITPESDVSTPKRTTS
eukprot:scaffold2983_cov122-Skeletonema_dohrnii-CCMP3373.AAC.2